MTILADENIDHPIVLALRQAGFQVFSVVEESPGIKDGPVLDKSVTTNSILLTGDKDFGEHVYRLKSVHTGVVLVRLFDLSLDVKIRIVLEVFNEHFDEMADSFTVIEPGKVRIKK